jgi:hypothetical protein
MAIPQQPRRAGHEASLDLTAEGEETPEQIKSPDMQRRDEVPGFQFTKPGPDARHDKARRDPSAGGQVL